MDCATQAELPSDKQRKSNPNLRFNNRRLSVFPAKNASWAYVVLLVAMLSNVTTGGLLLSNSMVVLYAQVHFNGTKYDAAWAMSTSWSFGGLLSPVITATSLKYSPRAVCVLGGFVASVGTLFNSFADRYVHVIVSYCIIASLGCFMCQISSAMIVEAHFYTRRMYVNKGYYCTQWFGMALMAVWTRYSLSEYGWLSGLQMSTMFVSLNFILGFAFNNEKSYNQQVVHRVQVDERGKQIVPWRYSFQLPLLRDTIYLRWLTIDTLITVSLFLVVTFTVLNVDRLQSDNESLIRGYFLLICGLTATIGHLSWPSIAKRLDVGPLFMLQSQLLTIAFIILVIVLSNSQTILYIATAAFGFFMGGITIASHTELSYLTKNNLRPFARSWSIFVKSVAVLICPPVVERIESHLDNYCIGNYIAGCGMLVAWFLILIFLAKLQWREGSILREDFMLQHYTSHSPSSPKAPKASTTNNQASNKRSSASLDFVPLHVTAPSGSTSTLKACPLHGEGATFIFNSELADYLVEDTSIHPYELGRRRISTNLPVLNEVTSEGATEQASDNGSQKGGDSSAPHSILELAGPSSSGRNSCTSESSNKRRKSSGTVKAFMVEKRSPVKKRASVPATILAETVESGLIKGIQSSDETGKEKIKRSYSDDFTAVTNDTMKMLLMKKAMGYKDDGLTELTSNSTRAHKTSTSSGKKSEFMTVLEPTIEKNNFSSWSNA